MKFYYLMKEHHEDLSRLIVSVLVSTFGVGMITHHPQTLENGKPLKEAKGENDYSSSFLEVRALRSRYYESHV